MHYVAGGCDPTYWRKVNKTWYQTALTDMVEANGNISRNITSWSLIEWRTIFISVITKLNQIVTDKLHAKLIICAPEFVDNKKQLDYDIVNMYKYSSLLKEICLLFKIPIVDITQITSVYDVKNHITRRNKCLPSESKGIHFRKDYARIIIWQLLTHVFTLCESDPAVYCNPVITNLTRQ